MRVLSLLQPWAWLVTAGPKDVENRTWHLPASMRGETFLVHASGAAIAERVPAAPRIARNDVGPERLGADGA